MTGEVKRDDRVACEDKLFSLSDGLVRSLYLPRGLFLRLLDGTDVAGSPEKPRRIGERFCHPLRRLEWDITLTTHGVQLRKKIPL